MNSVAPVPMLTVSVVNMFRIKDKSDNIIFFVQAEEAEKFISDDPNNEVQYKTYFESYEEAEARLKNALTIHQDKQISDYIIYEEV